MIDYANARCLRAKMMWVRFMGLQIRRRYREIRAWLTE